MAQSQTLNRKQRRALEKKNKTQAKTKMAWMASKDLKPGDKIVTKDGRIGTVTSVKAAPGLHTVHNFAVEDHHTYFVGDGPGVWVHNRYGLEDAVKDVKKYQELISKTNDTDEKISLRAKLHASYNDVALFADSNEHAAELVGDLAPYWYRQRTVESALSFRAGAQQLVSAQNSIDGGNYTLEQFAAEYSSLQGDDRLFVQREIWKTGVILAETTDKYYGGRYTDSRASDIYFGRPPNATGLEVGWDFNQLGFREFLASTQDVHTRVSPDLVNKYAALGDISHFPEANQTAFDFSVQSQLQSEETMRAWGELGATVVLYAISRGLGGRTPKWSPPANWKGPAAKWGSWSGQKGNSLFAFTDDAAKHYGVPAGTKIPFVQGTPNLSTFTKAGPGGLPGTFNVPGLRFTHKVDQPLIDSYMAAQTGLSKTAVRSYMTRNNLARHHFRGNTIQLVPKPLHNMGHIGPVGLK